MARNDIDLILSRIERMADEIEEFVPLNSKNLEFRADLAGLLVVAIVASYESCVKTILTNYAGKHHAKFAVYTQNSYERLNSRISLSDLSKYARTFDNTIHTKYGKLLQHRKKRLTQRVGRDITDAYTQILSWRHDFAHSGKKNTTVEEALMTHSFAKRVLYVFDEAFN